MFQQVQKMKSQQRQYKIEEICQKFPQMIKNNNLHKNQFKKNQTFINKLQNLPQATFNSIIKEKIQNQYISKLQQPKKHNRNQSTCIPLYNKQNKNFNSNQKKICQPFIINQKLIESKIHKRHISQAPIKKQIEFDFNTYKHRNANNQQKVYQKQISPIITSNQKRNCSSSSNTTINININSQLRYFNKNTVKKNKITQVQKQQPYLFIKQRYIFEKSSKQDNKFSIQELQCEEYVRIQQILHWKFIQKKQREERPDPYYLNRHKNITAKMRAILVDWIMQISTFHCAIRICDQFLSFCPSITMKSLQLIGLACLIISSKFNSYPRNINDLQISLNNIYSLQDIIQMQTVILKVDIFKKVIKYKINTLSFVFWIQLYIQLWQKTKPHYYPSMQGNSQQSYFLLRQVFHYADLLSLDIQSLQYLPRIIIGSLFYLVIGKAIKCFKQEVIAKEFNRSSKYIMNDSQYNYQFSKLISKFSLQLTQILPSIQYVSKCFRYNFQLIMPMILQDKGGKKQQTIYCQTYNKQYLQVYKSQFL